VSLLVGEVMNDKIWKALNTGDYAYFYNSRTWRRKRKEILSRDNKECQRCKAEGGFSKATCVHHIQHLRDRPDLALIDNNLIALCDSCHNKMHPEKLEFEKKETMSDKMPEWW
jgi:5-methylcytosine-specific restriction endonuclease McrA